VVLGTLGNVLGVENQVANVGIHISFWSLAP
jgi:hypothetical protein